MEVEDRFKLIIKAILVSLLELLENGGISFWNFARVCEIALSKAKLLVLIDHLSADLRLP